MVKFFFKLKNTLKMFGYFFKLKKIATNGAERANDTPRRSS